MKDLEMVVAIGQVYEQPVLQETENGLPYCKFFLLNTNLHTTTKKDLYPKMVEVIIWSTPAIEWSEKLKEGERIVAEGRYEMDGEVMRITAREISNNRAQSVPAT